MSTLYALYRDIPSLRFVLEPVQSSASPQSPSRHRPCFSRHAWSRLTGSHFFNSMRAAKIIGIKKYFFLQNILRVSPISAAYSPNQKGYRRKSADRDPRCGMPCGLSVDSCGPGERLASLWLITGESGSLIWVTRSVVLACAAAAAAACRQTVVLALSTMSGTYAVWLARSPNTLPVKSLQSREGNHPSDMRVTLLCNPRLS